MMEVFCFAQVAYTVMMERPLLPVKGKAVMNDGYGRQFSKQHIAS
jgi:hypothetical protein